MAELIAFVEIQEFKETILAMLRAITMVYNNTHVLPYGKKLMVSMVEVGLFLSSRVMLEGFRRNINSAMVSPAGTIQRVALRLIGTVHTGATGKGAV
ncbi:MAG TPA: hypothetical protein DCE41_08140 [Cytophagales bacterium]|nr:hypothetical protein [Cytophagales bacterium]HAA18546.1 hypothetical protein [Cytophagales bacterium]HAP62930.1 hypothetical protein [Cytophagales bacterium]